MIWQAYASDHSRLRAAGSGDLSFGLLQRKCACGGEEKCERFRAKSLQRWASGAAPESVPRSVNDALRSPGQSLDRDTRGFMETRFGHDFSRVRVHTDARATESASSVRAAAYTVGEHIVFGAGQYSPRSHDGKTLLAHELTHVVQQQRAEASQLDAMRHGTAAASAENEANVTAAHVAANRDVRGIVLSSIGPGLDRQPLGGGASSKTHPDPRQQTIEQARSAAFIRCILAHDITAGIGPPAPTRPDGKQGTDTAATEGQMRARHLASLMFDWPNPNMDQVAEIVSQMRDRLSPGISAVIAGKGDKYCGARAGYVIDHKPPIVLCDAFFHQSEEERVRTMVHEAAHLAGIGQSDPEGYCAVMDCSGPCPGAFDSADSWAQYVTCLTGHGDKSDVVLGKKPTH